LPATTPRPATRAARGLRATRAALAARNPRIIRLRRPGRLIASAVAAMCLLAAVAVLAACGAPGASSPRPSPSGDAHLYLTCLIGQLNKGGGTGARQACRSQRPAGGLGPALQSFARCLQGHGVVLPSESPGTTTGDALRYLDQVRTGSAAQRAAFSACQASTG
jgi:hypothetical protein